MPEVIPPPFLIPSLANTESNSNLKKLTKTEKMKT